MKERQKGRHYRQPINFRWMLPERTARVLSDVGTDSCSNIGLRLNKLIRARGVEIEKCQPLRLSTDSLKEVLQAFKDRWEEALHRLDVPPFQVAKFTAKTVWRLVVGLGAAHVRETSITLHHVHGFPVIPGTAIKGVTRAYAKLVLERDEQDVEFKSIFGTQESCGKVVFFDAIPLGDRVIPQVDVMTPHYSKYYMGEKPEPPADYLQPVPIPFYMLENAEFLFALGSTERGLLDKAVDWLKGALEEVGVGAKSGAGYGYLELTK